MKAVLVVVCSTLAVRGLVALPPEVRPPDEEQRVEAALGLTLEGFETLDLGSEEYLARVAAATDVGVDDLRSARLFLAHTTDGPVRIASVPIEGETATAQIAVDMGHGFVKATVAEPGDSPSAEWAHFLRNFEFYTVPRLERASPRSRLAELRAESVARDDEDGALIAGLLELLARMNEKASVFNLPREGRTMSPVEEADMMSRQYTAVAALAPALSPILGGFTEDFERIARDSSDLTASFARAMEAGDPEAMSYQRRIIQNCKACHEHWNADREEQLEATFTRTRSDLGIGDGFYEIGHDLRIAHHDRERAQRVADALRKGALLLDVYNW